MIREVLRFAPPRYGAGTVVPGLAAGRSGAVTTIATAVTCSLSACAVTVTVVTPGSSRSGIDHDDVPVAVPALVVAPAVA